MRLNQKYDSVKMFSLVEKYLSAGIMQKDLSERESLKKGTFKYWQRKYREESKANSLKKSSKKKKVITSDFIPISVPVVTVPLEHRFTQSSTKCRNDVLVLCYL